MTRWVAIFEDQPEMLNIRSDQARRDAHVAYVTAHPEILIGGGLKPGPDGAFCGALWVIETETRAQVERLIKDDPFYMPAYRTYEIYTWGKILEDRVTTL
ncbi:YciI family protein [Aliiroseovarius sp. 2305UL8-7]|uniref:YciI family protein n=1 Tax=Aliiroseovarius conchicola TaxID=3121637 RepID=UPI00352742D5